MTAYLQNYFWMHSGIYKLSENLREKHKDGFWIRVMDQTQTRVQPININEGFLSRPSPHSTVQFLWSSLNCEIVVTGVKISVSERGLRYLWSPVRQMIAPRSVVTGDQQGRTPHPPSLLAPRPGW